MQKKWFRRKRYGWGWYPATGDGWLVILVWVLVNVLVFRRIDMKSHSGSDTLIGMFVPFMISIGALTVICALTGEKPRWQWGEKKED